MKTFHLNKGWGSTKIEMNKTSFTTPVYVATTTSISTKRYDGSPSVNDCITSNTNNYERISNDGDNDILQPTKWEKLIPSTHADVSLEQRLTNIEKKIDNLTSQVSKSQCILQEEINTSSSNIQEYQRCLTSHLQKEIRQIQNTKSQALSDILKSLSELNKSVQEIMK